MAITYPLNTPTTIGIETINIRANSVVGLSESPFTLQQQVISYAYAERWEADVSIPKTRRDLSAAWVAMLVALRGPIGTFLLGDPDYASPRGTATSATLSGNLGSYSPTITMTGTLLAGDYIQLGSGSTARLHKVVQDRSGGGTIEIWPALRDNYTNATVTLSSPKGLFRLAASGSEWTVNSNGSYDITFTAIEAITGT